MLWMRQIWTEASSWLGEPVWAVLRRLVSKQLHHQFLFVHV